MSVNLINDDETIPAIRRCRNDDVDCDLHAAIIEIQCGQIHARLHMRQFVCPGIHQPCIEYDDMMITPKEFTIRANKDKQKDWKGSIRIGKSNLRVLMEMKSIEFYQHDTYCSGKCQSRNYIAMSKALEESPTTNNTNRIIEDEQQQQQPVISTTDDKSSTTNSRIIQHNFHSHLAYASMSSPSSMISTNGRSSNDHRIRSKNSQQQLSINNRHHHKRRFASISNDSLSKVHNTGAGAMLDNDNIKKLMISQPSQFWANMYHLGIIDDLIGDMSQAINQIKPLYAMRPDLRQCLSDKLSSIVCQLDLGESISQRIYTKRMQTLIESNHLTSELQELQRKAETQQKKHDDTRRKADLFDRLFIASTSASSNHITSSSSPSIEQMASPPNKKYQRSE